MLIAIISREPILRLEEWLAYVATRPENLVAPAPRVAENPFFPDRRLVTVRPQPGEVSVVFEDGTHGAIEPSDTFEADGELLVWGASEPSEKLKTLVGDVCVKLGGRVEWIPG